MSAWSPWCSACAPPCFDSGSVNQKVAPWPSSLCTPISPPMLSMSCLQIESPRPVPPNLRVVEASAWANAWKRCFCAAGAIPMPLSRMRKLSCATDSVSLCSSTRRETSPRLVNLIPLPSRLVSTWRKRVASPRRWMGTAGSVKPASSIPFAWAVPASRSSVPSTTSCKLKSRISNVSLPASIFEKSRMSLMTVSRFSPLARTVSV